MNKFLVIFIFRKSNKIVLRSNKEKQELNYQIEKLEAKSQVFDKKQDGMHMLLGIYKAEKS